MLAYLRKNIDITNLSWYKTPAVANYYFEINTLDDIDKLSEIYNFCIKNNLKFNIVAEGTNIFFVFERYTWVIIKNNLRWYKINSWDADLFSWENISEFCRILKDEHEINNLYPWIWLPWTVGWAVYWNAWCFRLRMEDLFITWKVLDLRTWKILIADKEWMCFSYRESILKKERNYFLIDCKINISKNIETVSYEEVINFRETKQPKWNSCWSVFINKPDFPASWKLIEDAWLKWFRVWKAFISPIHANFIIAEEWIKSKDILELIFEVKKIIKDKYWVELQEEINKFI